MRSHLILVRAVFAEPPSAFSLVDCVSRGSVFSERCCIRRVPIAADLIRRGRSSIGGLVSARTVSAEAGARGICAGLLVPGSPRKHTCAVTRGVGLPDAQPTTSARARGAHQVAGDCPRSSTAERGRRPHRRAPSPGPPGSPPFSCSFRAGPPASLADSASHVGQQQCRSVAPPHEGSSLAVLDPLETRSRAEKYIRTQGASDCRVKAGGRLKADTSRPGCRCSGRHAEPSAARLLLGVERALLS